jgi:single stranded DNA-binding protein
MNLNKTTLIGRIGHTPEVIGIKNAKKNVKLSIATSDMQRIPNSDAQEKVTQWHKILLLGCTDKQFEALYKGQLVYVEGRPVTSKYLDKDNREVTRTEVIANIFKMLSFKDQEPQEPQAQVDDDIPF